MKDIQTGNSRPDEVPVAPPVKNRAASQPADRRPRLFFVLGAKKSGTTWLQTMLNAHPDVVCHGEGSFHAFGQHLMNAMKAYNASLKGKEKLFGKAAFTPMGREEFARLFRSFILERIVRHVPPERKNRLLWIGEKDPDHAVHADIMMRMFPEATFIHIIRDPRDAAVSWWHHMYRFDAAAADNKSPDFETSCLKFAREWAMVVAKVRKCEQGAKVRYHELRYEALLQHPHDTLGGLLRFLAVSDTEDILSSCLAAADFRKLSGGRAPGEEDKSSFFRNAVIGDWKNHMDTAFADAFVRNVGELMVELNYAPAER